MYFPHRFIDIIAPSTCVSCGSSVSYERGNLCELCFNSIRRVKDGCKRCSGIVSGGKCLFCNEREFYLTKSIAVAEYSGVMKEVLYHYKFKGIKSLYRSLVQLIVSTLSSNDFQVDLITAIPLNRKKKWERGYNQSELIARSLAKIYRIPYQELCTEASGYRIQKSLSYFERFLNTLGKYSVINSAKIRGKRILIVDDVLTTGATVNECARILREAGARDIYAIIAARATGGFF